MCNRNAFVSPLGDKEVETAQEQIYTMHIHMSKIQPATRRLILATGQYLSINSRSLFLWVSIGPSTSQLNVNSIHIPTVEFASF